MRLRKKTLIIIGFTLVGMILLIYAASQVILMQSYADIENDEVMSALNSSLNEINYDLSTLDSVTIDYSYWDDTYSYVQNGSPEGYIQSNFVDATMLNQKLNEVVIANASGGIVYARGYDPETGDDYIPAGALESLSPGSPLFRSAATGSLHGIIMLPDGPMLISAYPILRSDGEGESAGTLIMGRFLGDAEIGVIRNMSGLAIAVVPYRDANTADGFGPAGRLAAGGPGAIVEPRDSDTVSGYTLIEDIYGNPALVLRVDEPRTVYHQAQNTLLYIVVSLLVSGFAFSAVMIFFLEAMVMSRIIRLSRSVGRISLDTYARAPVPVDGDDEVAQLAATINRTLDALGASRQRLQDEEQRLRLCAATACFGTFDWDIASDRHVWSPEAYGIYGVPPDALLTMDFTNGLVYPEDRKIEDLAAYLDPAGPGEYAKEYRIVRASDRQVRWIFVRARVFFTGEGADRKAVRVLGAIQDVTDRKQTEEALVKLNDELESRVQQRTAELRKANMALQESERKYRELVHYANSMIVRFDMDGRILYFNEFACRFFGYSEEEIVGMNVLDTIVPKTESSGRDLSGHLRDLLKHPDHYEINVNENVRRSGERVWVSWTNKAFLDDEGRVAGVLAIGNDITDLKRASEELKRVNDTLESRVQQRTADLAGAVSALQAEIAERRRVEAQIQSSLQEKEVLLKEIHHRVKNNLQIVSSILSLQTASRDSDPMAALRESQDRIRSMALIHEKLYQAHDLSRVDFREYARSLTAYLFRSYVTNPGVRIVIDIEGIYLDIDDAIPCGLIINELVSNALKYAFRDGRAGVVRVSLARRAGSYELTVGDDGVGLPPGLDFRDTPSLGLQLVNTLVGQLEGTIALDSSHGTTFRITFAGHRPGPGPSAQDRRASL